MPTTGSPLGAPFGVGTPITGDAPPSADSSLCRYINPTSLDYQLDTDTGQLAGMPVVRQRVLLAVLTVRGSAVAVPTLGINKPKRITENFRQEMALAIRAALYQLTDVEKVMRIDDILVAREGNGRVNTTIVYTDLTSGLPDAVSDAEAL